MLNILPKIEKKKIMLEYRLRLATVAVLAVTALILSNLVLLAPVYLIAVEKNSDAKNDLNILQESKSKVINEKDVNTEVLAVNKNIALFLKTGAAEAASPVTFISKILEIKGDLVRISGFTYDASGAEERMVVTGTARTRESLAKFIEALKKEPKFTSIDLPISSYVKSSNIDFSAVIVRKEKK